MQSREGVFPEILTPRNFDDVLKHWVAADLWRQPDSSECKDLKDGAKQTMLQIGAVHTIRNS